MLYYQALETVFQTNWSLKHVFTLAVFVSLQGKLANQKSC